MPHPLVVKRNPIDFGACKSKGGSLGGLTPFSASRDNMRRTEHLYSVHVFTIPIEIAVSILVRVNQRGGSLGGRATPLFGATRY